MSLVALPVFAARPQARPGSPACARGRCALTVAVPDLLFASLGHGRAVRLPALRAAWCWREQRRSREPSRRAQPHSSSRWSRSRRPPGRSSRSFRSASSPQCSSSGSARRRLRSVAPRAGTPARGVFGGVGLAVALVGVGRVLGICTEALSTAGPTLSSCSSAWARTPSCSRTRPAWILVPGALLGLALVLARPRSRGELAFGAIFLRSAVALLLEARSSPGQWRTSQERYVFYAPSARGDRHSVSTRPRLAVRRTWRRSLPRC